LLVLESKPSLYVSDNRGKDLKLQKLAKIQNRGFVKVSNQKSKRKQKKKVKEK
jgi:hypothetical protein